MKTYNVYAGKIRMMKVYAKNLAAAQKEAEKQLFRNRRYHKGLGAITVKEKID